MNNQCTYIGTRSRTIQCQLTEGHEGRHRAWDDDGIPILVMD